jgi:hypothetical protein
MQSPVLATLKIRLHPVLEYSRSLDGYGLYAYVKRRLFTVKLQKLVLDLNQRLQIVIFRQSQ